VDRHAGHIAEYIEPGFVVDTIGIGPGTLIGWSHKVGRVTIAELLAKPAKDTEKKDVGGVTLREDGNDVIVVNPGR
jgi:hypothetical protein